MKCTERAVRGPGLGAGETVVGENSQERTTGQHSLLREHQWFKVHHGSRQPCFCGTKVPGLSGQVQVGAEAAGRASELSLTAPDFAQMITC